jgi:hypothetical protein
VIVVIALVAVLVVVATGGEKPVPVEDAVEGEPTITGEKADNDDPESGEAFDDSTLLESEDPFFGADDRDGEVVSGPELEALLKTGPVLDAETAFLELEGASNLSDAATLTALKEGGGIVLFVGEKTYAKVEQSTGTGFEWLLDPQCEYDAASISSVIVDPNNPPTEDGTPSEVDTTEGGVGGPVGVPKQRIYQFEGLGVADCTFRITNAKSWEFTYDDNDDLNTFDTMIELPFVVTEAPQV